MKSLLSKTESQLICNVTSDRSVELKQ